jgi:hypothetical protein
MDRRALVIITHRTPVAIKDGLELLTQIANHDPAMAFFNLIAHMISLCAPDTYS